ncbi:MAG TPA: carboxylesterase/lipase family protein [Tepidiformaceae bacterium]|nr:carboxylesterase/lipase family protein [Tepidiformaceae bacterium]
MAIVETTLGKIEGTGEGGHQRYLGIPFAAPPVGPLRFKAPQQATSWEGVRPAKEWEKAARQTGHPIPGFAASGPQHEDCLYLNVYTPAADGRRRPVLYWIHGGGFTPGTAAEPLYDGGPLAERGDVVVVSINYRLGAFGYLWLGDHLPDAGLSANCGQLDAIAGLEWVRDNIAAFGGDPENVTIFGESAGAASVGTLLAMPAAKGLFHKAILQSGAGRAASRERGKEIAGMVLAELGLADNPAGILSVEADKLLEAQTSVAMKAGRAGGPLYGPVVDGVTLFEQPYAAVKAGSSAHVPVIIGTNRDETKLFAATMRREEIDDATLAKAVAAAVPKASSEQVATLIETYRGSRKAKGVAHSNLDIMDAINTDAGFKHNSVRLALAQREHQSDTYVYLFTYESPARGGSLGACHALEMPFVFGTTKAPTQDRFAGSGPDVEQLSENMMDAWISFARTGKPGHEGIGAWEPFDAARRPTMVFDRHSGLENDPYGEERRAVEALVQGEGVMRL